MTTPPPHPDDIPPEPNAPDPRPDDIPAAAESSSGGAQLGGVPVGFDGGRREVRSPRSRRRLPGPAVGPVVLIAAGAVVAGVAVVRASAAVLAVAGLLLLAATGVTAVLARRRLEPRRQTVAVVAVVALSAVILLPASMNVDRCTRLGRDADLSGCDLSDRDLTAEDLHGADLRQADLRGTDLSGVDLGLADLRDARLRGANLSDARMGNVSAAGADLRDARLDGATLAEIDLTGARVQGARLPDAALAGAVLADLDLSDVDLTGATLTYTDLSGADLTGAKLAGADLSNADLRDADLSGADLAAVEGSGATRVSRPARLAGTDLRGANLSGADLTDVGAPGADFEDADLTGTQLVANDFVGAEGIGSDDLSVAFGVPGRQVAGELARRGVVLDTYDEIVQAVTPVRDGRAVPDVQPYVLNDEFHPAIVFDTTLLPGASSWADAVRDQWAPTGIRYAELVVVVSSGRESVETCQYVYLDGPFAGMSAPSITRYVPTATVRVFAAHDHGLVGERTFRGGDPAPCPEVEGTGTTEIEGAPPDVAGQARPWLSDLVNPPAERLS